MPTQYTSSILCLRAPSCFYGELLHFYSDHLEWWKLSLFSPLMNTELDTWPKVGQPEHPLPLAVITGLEMSMSPDRSIKSPDAKRTQLLVQPVTMATTTWKHLREQSCQSQVKRKETESVEDIQVQLNCLKF